MIDFFFFQFAHVPGLDELEKGSLCSYLWAWALLNVVLITLFDNFDRVEDAIVRYLNRKPAAGSNAPGSTW